ncbi:MAG: polyprenyl diphosphate synthase [Thermoleophilia bacterium]
MTADRARYVAVIMDGNGRWAARRHLPAIAGHREGARALKRVIRSARKLRIEELTVYAFSTENWQRPQDEVDALMSMFSELIDKEVPELDEQDVRVRFIGRRSGLSTELREKMDWAQQLTADNGAMTLFVAFNYGGRAELEDAARAACSAVMETGAEPDLRRYLYAPEMHDPQLLIRTSGEQRVSNFLLWQCAYSELYFSDRLWPEFDETDLAAALNDFQQRQRRFGGR